MRTKQAYAILCSLILFSVGLQAQSLIEDARRLVAARDTLMQTATGSSSAAQQQAFAEAMAILQQYGKTQADSMSTAAQWADVAPQYADNQLLSDWLPMQALNAYAAAPDSLTLAYHRSATRRLQQAPRERLAQATQGMGGQSPADYFSISQALQRYSVPPVESRLIIKSAAENSNRNVREGLVDAQVLLEGVFQFVLERAQQEVAINFLDRFLEKDIPPVKALFPTVFREVSTTSFSYSQSYLERVRTAFYTDLQLLSIRLPSILLEEERFEPLQQDPLLYNLLSVYTIIGLSQKEMPLDEVMSVTHRSLLDNYAQQGKKLNFTLADQMGQSQQDFSAIETLSEDITDLLRKIYLGLNEAENALEDSLQSIERRRSIGQDEVPTPSFDYLFKPAYRLDALMGEDDQEAYRLNFLPYLLRGRLDSAYLMGIRSMATYDRYFSEEPTERMLMAAGLEIARRLGGTWHEEQTLADLLSNWAEGLTSYHRSLDEWKYQVLPDELEDKVYQDVEAKRLQLRAAVQGTKAYWANRDSLSYQQGLAFDVLSNILGKPYNINSPAVRIELMAQQTTRPALLRKWQQDLQDVEARFLSLNERIAGEETELSASHPVNLYLLGQDPAHPYATLLLQIKAMRAKLNSLKKELERIDEEHAPLPYQLKRNAEPMLFLTETLSHLTYCLRSDDPDQIWIDAATLDSALNNVDLRAAFLGLLYQRMRQVKQIRNISPDGLAQLVQMTVAELGELRRASAIAEGRALPLEDAPLSLRLNEEGELRAVVSGRSSRPDLAVAPDSLAFYRKASFVVNTLNRLLELPLIVDDVDDTYLLPLVERYPQLAQVPDLSNRLLDMVYHLNRRDHRQAIGASLGLFATIGTALAGHREGQEELGKFLGFLNEYGYFIAGLVDARTDSEVKSLLEGIADPPGSSRLKRKKDVTVALNAYLGASVGQEQWERSSTNTEETFESVMPTMPIGFSISRRFGKRQALVQDSTLVLKQADGHSFSVFLSLLDLGSFFAYAPGDTAFGDTDLTFKNVFKPGVQLHYNFRNSPFYTGLGIHRGPQYRELIGDQISLQSTRVFLSFGVDVPIKTIFVR